MPRFNLNFIVANVTLSAISGLLLAGLEQYNGEIIRDKSPLIYSLRVDARSCLTFELLGKQAWDLEGCDLNIDSAKSIYTDSHLFRT